MMNDSFILLQIGFNIVNKLVNELKSQRAKVRVVSFVEVLIVHIDDLGRRGLRRLVP